jgi:hypothetical protein
MALFKGNAGQLSGSVGGVTYSRGRGGAICRVKVAPTQPDTPAQVIQRGRMAGISKLWAGSVDEPKKRAWNQRSKEHPYRNAFGDAHELSGFGYFVQMNLDSMTSGETVVDTPPIYQIETALTAMTFTITNKATRTITIVWAAEGETEFCHVVLRVANNVSPGVSFVKNLYRIATVTPVDMASPLIVALPESVGELTTGRKLFVQMSLFDANSRQYSGGLEYSVVIA